MDADLAADGARSSMSARGVAAGLALRAGAAFSTLALVLAATGCAPTSGSEEVRAYIDEVVPFLKRGIMADDPAGEERRRSTVDELYEAATIEETYAGLQTLAVETGGSHSRFISPLEVGDWETTTATVRLPEVASDGFIGTMKLPDFNSSDDDLEQAYAAAALNGVRDLRSDASCGWVIDLTDNAGGNMFPMLASVAPMLDDGTVLRIKGKEGESRVDIDDGYVRRFPIRSAVGGDVSVDTPVALLISSGTSSAAEAVVISFLGQDDVRVFGSRTAGYTTGNEVFTMSDGARMVLTTGFMVDRGGTSYDGPIEPDVSVNPRSRSDASELARHWLMARC